MFLLGLAPFFGSVFAFVGLLSDDETEIWLGDLRVVGGCGAVVTWMLPKYMTTVSYTFFDFLDASFSVRTEP